MALYTNIYSTTNYNPNIKLLVNSTAAEKEMSARIINTLFIAFVFILIALKPLVAIQNNTSNDITASIIGAGLFKNSFLRFVLVTYVSFFILHTYFPNVIPFLENYLAAMSIQQFLKLNIIWINLFIFYFLMQLYYISTINPSRAYSLGNLPLPRFIKSHFILLNKLATEDKNKILKSLVVYLSIYVCMVIILTLLSLFL